MSRSLLLVNQTFLSPETNFALAPGKFILGRSASCDLVVPDSSLSRRHCEISVVDSAITLSDLGSHNGTFIHGVRVRSATVTEGQHVQFGRVVFLLARPDSRLLQFDLEDETLDARLSRCQPKHQPRRGGGDPFASARPRPALAAQGLFREAGCPEPARQSAYRPQSYPRGLPGAQGPLAIRIAGNVSEELTPVTAS